MAAGDGQADRVVGRAHQSPARRLCVLLRRPRRRRAEAAQRSAAIDPELRLGTLGYVRRQQRVRRQLPRRKRHPARPGGHARSATWNDPTAAPVTARLIPVIGELALEAKDGTLLRRSQGRAVHGARASPACRRGSRSATARNALIDPYIPIPVDMRGPVRHGAAARVHLHLLRTKKSASSWRTNTGSPDPHAVLQDPKGEPVLEEGAAKSGLFCALNRGVTTVTISAGGLSASLPVEVQAGSVRQPCGTTPLKEHPASQQQTAPPPPAPTQPTPSGAAPASLATAGAPAATAGGRGAAGPPTARGPAVRPAGDAPAGPAVPVRSAAGSDARRGPRLPAAPRRSPRRSRSPKRKRSRRRPPSRSPTRRSPTAPAEQEPGSAYLLGMIVLAAFAGASIRRRPRRGRREVRVAPATISGARSQRRISAHTRRHR